jgi:hypothetical protein
MNLEYLYWFAILVAVGLGAVAFLAVGHVPEITDTVDVERVDPPQSVPLSTTFPGPVEPDVTSETP